MYAINHSIQKLQSWHGDSDRSNGARSQSGGDTPSGLIFADDPVGISESSITLKEHIEEAREHTRR